MLQSSCYQKGWVKFISENGAISEMLVGSPLTFNQWIDDVRTGDIFLDSGMYFDPIKPNERPYSNWRASNSFWESLKHKRFS